MFDFTPTELAGITGGVLQQESLAPERITGFFIDSREVAAEGAFIAIKGERVDGHDFLHDVAEAGTRFAIVSDSFGGKIPKNLCALVVPNPVVALGQIAHWVRVTHLRAIVVAVTGSSGKTTTKDLIAGILSQCGPTVAPAGSFNTEIGLPLTILRAGPDTEFLVLEMGMRGIGHIELLAEIARPDIGVITNVGSAHIELLGSRENIAQAKGELIRSLGARGSAVLNADDPLVMSLASSTRGEIVTFGKDASSDFRATDIEIHADGFSSYVLDYQEQRLNVAVNLVGEHNVSNSLAAIAASVTAGVDVARAVNAVSTVTSISKWRMEITETAGGITVINDAYNANPESMRAALKTLANFGVDSAHKGGQPRRRTWAVLGEMRELGEFSRDEHDAIGRLAVRLDISRLVCVGEPTKIMHLGASLEGSWGEESIWVSDADEAIAHLSAHLQPGDVVLVKASRSIGLEKVAQALTDLLPENLSQNPHQSGTQG